MSEFRLGEAAQLLGVSTDTVRRWADAERLVSRRTDGGQRLIDGASLASLAVEEAETKAVASANRPMSARNRFVGLVTEVVVDTVMAQVELQCGQNRIVALVSAEAVRDLGLEPGVRAVATIKATNVIIEGYSP